MWEPEVRNLLSPGYAKVHDLIDSEMSSILTQGGMYQPGMCPVPAQQGPVERVQQFLVQMHQNVFVILGQFGETLGEQFYAQPGLAVAVAGTACFGMDHIPDQRLRSVVRVFCRPFVIFCPAHLHQSVLLPFFAHLFPAMLQRLAGSWQDMMQQQRERSPELLEIFRDVVVRLLTRDYIDVLKIILLSVQPEENEDMMDADQQAGPPVSSVSELGKSVLAEPSLAGHLLQCLLSGLWWPDTSNSIRSTRVLDSVVKYWANLNPRNSAQFPNCDVATLCLSHLLNGIQLLGQHDANLAELIHLGVLMYDTFLPIYPAPMSEVMMRHAGCSREDADLYQDKAASLAAAGGHKTNQKLEKSKRELFRKMTVQVS